MMLCVVFDALKLSSTTLSFDICIDKSLSLSYMYDNHEHRSLHDFKILNR